MRKLLYILTIALAATMIACAESNTKGGKHLGKDVVAQVDNERLYIADIKRDMPAGLTGADSTTFVKMYVENWIIGRLKMKRAEEVLSSSDDIERLVEGYRQSLIMRQLDQYYIDKGLDTEITDKQIAAYYRAHSASFKLDHNVVRGVIVKTPKTFRNTTTLTTALKTCAKEQNWMELHALTEKHSLTTTDMSETWVSYSDFLSNLPTERSQSYTNLLTKGTIQQMSSSDANFYFIITDLAKSGETAPLASVENDIRRQLYAERRAQIVEEYEAELKRSSIEDGRVMMRDEALLKAMSYTPEPKPATAEVREAEENIEEDIIPTDTIE